MERRNLRFLLHSYVYLLEVRLGELMVIGLSDCPCSACTGSILGCRERSNKNAVLWIMPAFTASCYYHYHFKYPGCYLPGVRVFDITGLTQHFVQAVSPNPSFFRYSCQSKSTVLVTSEYNSTWNFFSAYFITCPKTVCNSKLFAFRPITPQPLFKSSVLKSYRDQPFAKDSETFTFLPETIGGIVAHGHDDSKVLVWKSEIWLHHRKMAQFFSWCKII